MIRATGLGSGLDIDGLVSGLVAAEGDPARERLLRDEGTITSEISAFSQMNSSLLSLKSASDALNAASAFTTQTVNTSAWSEVVPTLSGEAAVGSYSLSVTTLASAQTLATANTFASVDTVISTGTLSISLGTPAYTNPSDTTYASFSAASGDAAVDVVIDSTNNTLGGLRDAINAADAGVNASVVKDGAEYRLLIASAETGLSNSISISVVNDEDLDNTDNLGLSAFAFDGTTNSLTQTRGATDAAFTVNGLALTSSTNSVSSVLDGIDLELKKTTDAVTIDVTYDDTTIADNVADFVSAYNVVVSTISSLTSFDAATGIAGDLQGESIPRSALASIRNTVTAQVTGLSGSLDKLNDVGIQIQDDGTLELTRSTLTGLLATNRNDVKELFSGDRTSVVTTDGFSGGLSALIDNYTGTSGLIASKTESLDSRIEAIEDARERLETRLTDLEDRYYRQFNAMDALIARLNSTGDFLLAQLDSMPAANRDKK